MILPFLVPLLTHCLGTSAPPAPIAEIPAFLVFPSTVSISVDRIEAEASPPALKNAVASGGTYSELIALEAEIAESTNLINDAILSAVGGVTVPITSPVRHYDSKTDSKFTKKNPIKIDFGDFDLDGDGLDEGCSGCTCPVGCTSDELAGFGGFCPTSPSSKPSAKPVCFRLWLDDGSTGNYERFVAGAFNEVPLDSDGDGDIDTTGAGSYRGHIVTEGDPLNTDGSLGVVYDHTDSDDPLKKFTDLSLVNLITDAAEGTPLLSSRVHSRTDQEAAVAEASPEQLKKTLKVDYELDDAAEEILFEFINAVSQFRDDGDFWIGTIDGHLGSLAEDQCVDLRTGNAAPAGECEAIGISVEGETISRAKNEDVAFPNETEFPPNPCDSPNLAASTGC